jgi:hypothetical protein
VITRTIAAITVRGIEFTNDDAPGLRLDQRRCSTRRTRLIEIAAHKSAALIIAMSSALQIAPHH